MVSTHLGIILLQEIHRVLYQGSYCVWVKRITLCNCLCSCSSSPSRFSANAIRNIGEFGAKSYFTDHRRANTTDSFTDSVPVLKIYNCYQDTQTFEQLSISTQAITRREQCVDVSNPLQTIFKYFKLQLCNYSNCTIDQLLYYWQTFQPIFVAK